MSTWLIIGIIASTATWSRSAQAEGDQSVGITVALAIELSDIERGLLEERLGEALAERFEVTIVAGDAAQRKLVEKPSETCIAENPCLSKVASTLGVDRLLMLVAVRVGNDVQVDATLYEAKSGQARTLPSVKMSAEASMWKAAFVENADRLLPGAPLRPIKDNSADGEIPTAVVVTGVAGVSLGALASILALVAYLQSDDADNDKSFPFDRDCQKGDSCKRVSLAADISGALSIGLSLSSIVLYALRPSTSDGPEQRVGLRPGPGDLGVAIGVSF